MATYNGVPVPAGGQPIEYSNGKYRVPNRPIVPFIEGDGTGRDIWKASVRVFDAGKGLWRKTRGGLVRSFCRRESESAFSKLAP